MVEEEMIDEADGEGKVLLWTEEEIAVGVNWMEEA